MRSQVRRCLQGFSILTALLPSHVSSSLLQPRDNAEHVVLADCRDGDGIVSSQMAYFPGNPGPKPQDVSVVSTPAGQAALWAGMTTSSQWTDTGVVFTAVLGAKNGEGSFAGTGDNGYGNFTCWQRFKLNLYEYSGTTCSMVYDCDHEKAPATTPTPTSVSLSGATHTNDASSTPSSTPQPSGMSTGAVAGVAVGITGAVLIAAAAAVFFFMRRRSRRKAAEASVHEKSTGASPKDAPPEYASPMAYPVYEMDGQWHGVESGGHARAEMEAAETPQEMDARRKSAMSAFQKR